MDHPYDDIVANLKRALSALKDAGLEDILSKGGVGAILLAHHLNHELVPGDKEADAADAEENSYEYKVSVTD